MLAQPLFEAVLHSIFAKLQAIFNLNICKRQRRFLIEAFRVLFAHQGRSNFSNLSRYSTLHEHTFRRHFGRCFDWLAFNMVVLRLRAHPAETLIGVFDTSFIPKSGRRSWGLDKFFSHAAKAMRTGLELSLLAVIATQSRRTIALDATQTPPGLSKNSTGPSYSRIDFYLEQITDLLEKLPKVRYWIGDGYYARVKVFNKLAGHERYLITKLRSDANLRFVIDPEKRRGRYGAKVRFEHFEESGFQYVGPLEDLPHIKLYSAHVNSEHFWRDLRLVVLHNQRDDSYIVLCSSDVDQDPREVVRFYRLRYQLEFVIRDAKQHLGLTHCQARSQTRLDFHFNIVVAAVNVGRLMAEHCSLSLASLTRELYNTFIVDHCLSQLSPEAELGIRDPALTQVIQMGRILY